jgi:hypothetical protein
MRLVLVVSLTACLASAVGVGCGRDEQDRGGAARASGEVGPVVTAGKPGYALGDVAVGEGGVWFSGWDRRGGLVSRLDAERGRVLATVRVPHDGPGDVAVGAGAVWSAGAVCTAPHPEDPADVCITEPRVSRIDPLEGQVVATIAVPPPAEAGRDTAHPSAVAVGERAVWVAVSWDPRTGEVLRIDPRTNEIAARIPTGGFVGELRLGSGSVWVLSHREYTDETTVEGASLLRIDPATNAVIDTPVREELSLLGGDLIPPVMAAGDDSVWVASPTAAHPRRALRVDTETGHVAREELPVERFYPVAVEDRAIWFIGSSGRTATLGRLDPRTLEQTHVTELPIGALRAAHDPSTDSFWIGSLVTRYDERAKLVRARVH